MSTKPHPVALTAAMLAIRLYQRTRADVRDALTHCDTQSCASLASTLHRIAKGCQRQAVAECNGEWRDGQRDAAMGYSSRLAELDADIAKAGDRLDKRLAKLNAQLAPLALEARRSGDPRGLVLRLYSTDKTKPVPCNSGDGESWGIL